MPDPLNPNQQPSLPPQPGQNNPAPQQQPSPVPSPQPTPAPQTPPPTPQASPQTSPQSTPQTPPQPTPQPSPQPLTSLQSTAEPTPQASPQPTPTTQAAPTPQPQATPQPATPSTPQPEQEFKAEPKAQTQGQESLQASPTEQTLQAGPPALGAEPAAEKGSWLEKNIPSLAKLVDKIKNLRKPKKEEQKVTMAGTVEQKPQKKKSFKQRFENYYLIFIRKKSRLFFLDQLTTLVASDIRMIDGLRLLKQQSSNWAMKRLITRMIADVESGKQLSESMNKYYPFPKMWVNLIKAGESSGQLATILKELNEQQTAQSRLMGNIKGALVYPVFVIVMLIVLMVIMMTTIVPEIESIYQQARVDLPGITQMIINISRFTVANGVSIAIGALIVLILFIIAVKKVYYIKKAWDWLNLRWPVFGELNKKRNIIIFSDNVQLLLQSGILLTEALQTTSDIVPSINYREEIMRVHNKITQGETMSKAMGLIDPAHEKFEANFYFPLEFAQMVSVGEQTGNTNSVLNKIKETYSDKVQHMVKNLSTLLEPIMIILVGGMVLVFLLGIMLPFFNLGQVARGL